MEMIQIGVIGVAGALLAVQFKSAKAEYGVYIGIVLSILIFFGVLDLLGEIISAMREIGTYIQVDAMYMGTMIKMIGITYIAEFSSGICKDAGYQSIAAQIEIFGKLAVLALSLPVLVTLLHVIRDFLS